MTTGRTEKMSALKMLQSMAIHRQQSEVFSAFVKMSACALSCGLREEEYMDEAKKWTKAELQTFSEALGSLTLEMEALPFTDLLGNLYMETLGKGQSRGGEFHTPQSICEMIGAICGDELPKEGPIRVGEPACGAGAMILGFAARIPKADIPRLRVDAWDISKVSCDMCYINTTLWNIPTIVTHADTLAMKGWGRWCNFPMVQAAPLSWRNYTTPIFLENDQMSGHGPQKEKL